MNKKVLVENSWIEWSKINNGLYCFLLLHGTRENYFIQFGSLFKRKVDNIARHSVRKKSCENGNTCDR